MLQKATSVYILGFLANTIQLTTCLSAGDFYTVSGIHLNLDLCGTSWVSGGHKAADKMSGRCHSVVCMMCMFIFNWSYMVHLTFVLT